MQHFRLGSYSQVVQNISSEYNDVIINCTANPLINPYGRVYNIGLETDQPISIQNRQLFNIIIKDSGGLFRQLSRDVLLGRKICFICQNSQQASCAMYVCYLMYCGYDMDSSISYLQYIKKDAFKSGIQFIQLIRMFNQYVQSIDFIDCPIDRFD